MWYNKTSQEVLSELKIKSADGLTNDEAKARIEQYGPNRLAAAKRKTWSQRFFAQINNVLIYVLLAAAVISLLVDEIADAIIIGIVVIINAVVGMIQESRAEEALEALKNLSTPKAIVKRDGVVKEIDSSEVVPGDQGK